MKTPTILSLEQALALPYATMRMVHRGWRVIRLEATPREGDGGRSGDPNRWAGRDLGDPGRYSYFVAPNCGKQAITVNLKTDEGRALLLDMIRKLPIDVFCCNVLPRQYAPLGIDYDILRAANPRLIWVGVSAFGPEQPNAPGYDPALQARLGFMDLTGDPAGSPMLCGVPVIDLKTGDEVYTQVLDALFTREETGQGRRIDVRMSQAATSWLLTKLSLPDLGHDDAAVTRTGNRHPIFVPVDTFPCRDGYVSIAVGNDGQWRALVAEPEFKSLDRTAWASNLSRKQDEAALIDALAAITRDKTVPEVLEALTRARIPSAAVTSIADLRKDEWLAECALYTHTSKGECVMLAPPSTSTAKLDRANRCLPFAPRYSEHTNQVLTEIGLIRPQIAALRSHGVVV